MVQSRVDSKYNESAWIQTNSLTYDKCGLKITDELFNTDGNKVEEGSTFD
jgi:hypothetical protein